MGDLYPFCFLLLFELLVLVSLHQYSKSVDLRYVRYAYVAMTLEILSQLTFHSSMFIGTYAAIEVLGEILKLLFCTFIILAVANIVQRKSPLFLIVGCCIAFVLISVSISLLTQLSPASGQAPLLLTNLPAVLLLSVALVWLVQFRSAGMLGITWMTGLVAIHLYLKVVLPFLGDDLSFFQIVYYFNANIVVLLGISFLLMGSEVVVAVSYTHLTLPTIYSV